MVAQSFKMYTGEHGKNILGDTRRYRSYLWWDYSIQAGQD
jgi:hypothetical protein